MLGPWLSDQIRARSLPKRLQTLAAELQRPALTRSYAIAGRCVLVKALDDWSARVAGAFLRDFHFQSSERAFNRSGRDVSYTIRIRSESPPPPIPGGLKDFEVAFGHCYVDGNTYYLHIEDSLVVVGPGGTELIDVWIGKSDHARGLLSLVNVMSYALDAALRRCGLYQLHGAGVAPPKDGDAALILGKSGSGKSTLASILAAGGWRYLTDDALLLAEFGEVVVARGIRKFFAASETTLKASSLSDLSHALGPPMRSDPSKRRLEPAEAFPQRFIESCTPRVLCFTAITGEAKSHVSSLRSSEAMTRLIRSNPWASYDKVTAREHLRLLNLLASQCRSFSLDAGSDILANPSCAADLLAPLLNI